MANCSDRSLVDIGIPQHSSHLGFGGMARHVMQTAYDPFRFGKLPSCFLSFSPSGSASLSKSSTSSS